MIIDPSSQQEFSDADFRIVDSADQSKKLRFDPSGITTATTRTWTVPDIDVTISSFAATLLDDTTAGAALTTLGVSSYMQATLDDASITALLASTGLGVNLGAVADDGVASVAVTTAATGFLVLWCSNQSNLGGVLVGRTASTSNGGSVIAQTGTTQTAVATSLTGTTGTDGQITFGFANNGTLYFENRRGSAINVFLFILRLS